jgi:DNA-directed RNA polymerase subunit K/omega
MKQLILSRTPEIDIQQCTHIVGGNKFELVLIVSQRARELRRQNPNERHNYTVEALLDLQDNKLNTAEMLKKRINHVNKPAKNVDRTHKRKRK